MGRKRKQDEGTVDSDEISLPKPSGPIGTSMKSLLAKVSVAKPDAKAGARASGASAAGKPGGKKSAVAPTPPPKRAPEPPPAATKPPPAPAPVSAVVRPSETLRGHDRTAFLDAVAGVRPLSATMPRRIGAAAPPPKPLGAEDRDRDAHARARLADLVAGGVRFDVFHEGDWIEGYRVDTKASVIDELRRAVIPASATLDLHGMRAADAKARVDRFVREARKRSLQRVLIVHGKGLHSEAGPVLADVVIQALTEGAAAASTVAFVTASPANGGAGALVVQLVR